jgi:hypothetical protein
MFDEEIIERIELIKQGRNPDEECLDVRTRQVLWFMVQRGAFYALILLSFAYTYYNETAFALLISGIAIGWFARG